MEAISAITLNTMTVSRLADPKKVYYSLKKSIDAAARFVEHELDNVTLTAAKITSREVHVGVRQEATWAQLEQIIKAMEYAQENGITLIITKVK